MLQNSAKPALTESTQLIYSVVQQGAGLVNVYDAATARTLVTPSVIGLNDTQFRGTSYTLTVWNQHSSAVTYNFSSIGATTAFPFVNGDDIVLDQKRTSYTPDYCTVKFLQPSTNLYELHSTRMVLAGTSITVKLSFTPPTVSSNRFPIFSGYIIIAPIGVASSFPVVSVPYAGMVGRWKQAPIWSRKSPLFRNQFGDIVATGIYDKVTLQPIVENGQVNASKGMVISTVASTSTTEAGVLIIASLSGTVYFVRASGIIRHETNEVLPVDRSLFFNPFLRMDLVYNRQPLFWVWNGDASRLDNNAKVNLPRGKYKMLFFGRKHFSTVSAAWNDSNYMDLITTPSFHLI